MDKAWQKFGLMIFGTISIALIFYGATLYQSQIKQKSLEDKIAYLEQEIESLRQKQIKILAEKTASDEEEETALALPQNSNSLSKNLGQRINQIKVLETESCPNLGSVAESQIPIEKATVEILGFGKFESELKNTDTAFTLLLRTAEINNFEVKYQNYEGLGAFITCLAKICSHDNYYWAFYYNGKYSQLGVSSQSIKNGDTITFKLESW